jgi:hypothetical protein
MDCPVKSSHLDVPPPLNIDLFMSASLFSHEGITKQFRACYDIVKNPSASYFENIQKPVVRWIEREKLTRC